MLGDTAVAVNPNDERYKDLVGKTVIVPFVNREIPVIADEYVDMDFGTGVVKITPAHDPNDFEVGRRHNLPVIRVMNDDGTMNENAGEFAGLDRLRSAPNQIVCSSQGNGHSAKGRTAQAQRRQLLSLPYDGGAHRVQAVVCQDGAACKTRYRSGEKGRNQIPPRTL